MKIVFVDNLTCTTNPKKKCSSGLVSTQNSLLHKTGLKPIVFYGGLSKGTFKNNFRSPSVLQSNLDYPDSLGPHEIVRIIEGPDNRKYEY